MLPKAASFGVLYERCHEPGNGERIDQALYAIEGSQRQLRETSAKVHPGHALTPDKLGEEPKHSAPLLGKDFRLERPIPKPVPCRRWATAIGNAYEYLIKKPCRQWWPEKPVSFIPPEVSDR